MWCGTPLFNFQTASRQVATRNSNGPSFASSNGKRCYNSVITGMTTLKHQDYTVGWICALWKELAVSMAMLDTRHEPLQKPSTDPNTYILGSISGHNVVLACLPTGQMGTTSAATVATHMSRTFPCLRFGILVGIAGGIPNDDCDIR